MYYICMCIIYRYIILYMYVYIYIYVCIIYYILYMLPQNHCGDNKRVHCFHDYITKEKY